MNKPCFLIVEDDKAVRNLIATTLEIKGYQYRIAKTGAEAISETISNHPDLIILDLGLPDMNGNEIIKRFRTWSRTPIIVVSARTDDRDKIMALDAGADDYLTKPFSVDELLARIRVALRHVELRDGAIETSSVFINGKLRIDYASGCVSVNGRNIHLTPIEYRLLCLLAGNVGKVLTHNYIIQRSVELTADRYRFSSCFHVDFAKKSSLFQIHLIIFKLISASLPNAAAAGRRE